MAEIVEFESLKERRYAKLKAQWEEAMTRAEEFHAQGKREFAKPFLAKARQLRAEMDKLKKPTKVRTALDEIPEDYEGLANFEYTFKATLVEHKRPDDDSTS